MYYLCSENKGTDQLRIFVFAYAKFRFSHDEAHISTCENLINAWTGVNENLRTY